VKRPLASAFAAALALIEAGPLAGASTTASLSVSVTVSSNCQISTASVAFGTYDPVLANFSAPATGTGGVTITCTRGSSASLTLGPGANPSGSTRRMRGGTSFITYELYKPASESPGAPCSFASPKVWGAAGDSVFTPSSAPSRDARSYNVCGRIPEAQDVLAATYFDAVVATANF
jgi:spore coat protein U-like protein